MSAGTSTSEAMEILGEAHAYTGSGMIGSIYELTDGTEVTVYFANDSIDQIRTYHEDGSFDIIVQ